MESREGGGPLVLDPDTEVAELVKKAAAVAGLTEEVMVRAITSFFATAIANLAGTGKFRELREGMESPEFPERLAFTTLGAMVEREESKESLGEHPLRKELAERLRERLGDTTTPVDESELSDGARSVLDALEDKGPLTITGISLETGIPPADVVNAVNELKRAGLVEVKGDKVKPKTKE